MQDEFDRIMEFFNLDPEEKEARLQEVFEDSVEYFERFKYVMVNGTPEEKKAAVQKVMLLKKKIEEETERVCKKTGMTPEQLTAYSRDPKNFSDEQWNAIEGAKKRLEEGSAELKKQVQGKSSKDKGDGDEPPKKKPRKPKNWIPS